ncbi:hypothetical protein K501DRAFT_278516 [Backusella circina FSU 941]|nr:hypothetical protein K501DRAFT_278516 [Backusella circina FSU 941]
MMNLPSLPSGTTLVINSFNPSSQNNKKSVYLPGAVRHSFLQNPSWTFTLNKIKSRPEKNTKDDKKPSNDSNTILVANPLPNLTLQIQLPAFYSVATVLRCGHMSQLVGKWLCNPMEQLKKQSRIAYPTSSSQQSNRSTISIMPDSDALLHQQDIDLTTKKADLQNSLVRYKKNESGLTSLSLCLEDRNRNLQALELVFVDTLPLETSTIISISYQCGSFSISIQSISNLQFVSSTTYPVPVVVNCQFNQSMTIAVTQFGDTPSFAPFQTTPYHSIKDSQPADEMTANNNNNIPNTTEKEEELLGYDVRESLVEFIDPYLPVWTPPEDIKASSQMLDFEQDNLLGEYQEDDSSEEYDDSEDSEEEDLAHIALLSLVQDTLEYITSNRGAYCDELNSLKGKLQNYYISCFE